jgi:hypothetical protein
LGIDRLIPGEPMEAERADVMRHVADCAGCAAELEARERLRTRLQAAVKTETAPADLQVRIRAKIEREASRGWFFAWRRPLAIAGGAALALGIFLMPPGVFMNAPRYGALPAIGDRPPQDAFIRQISSRVAAALQVGLKDHVHCAVFRKYPKDPPGADQMEQKLGADYKGLLPIVKAGVPVDYKVILAHQCSYQKRQYIHLTLSNGEHLLSLVISRKEAGESLAGLKVDAHPSGVAVFQAAAERYEIAGFETDRFLAFVVSDLSGGNNLHIAEALAPAVHKYLAAVVAG